MSTTLVLRQALIFTVQVVTLDGYGNGNGYGNGTGSNFGTVAPEEWHVK